jgi:uncharacterized protein YutE (UPF0331/DUF86 family)
MTDVPLVLKTLAVIETCASELRRLANPAQLESDIKERRFVERTLQVALQAVLDVCSHIVSDERLGEPATNRDLVRLAAANGWVAPDLANTLQRMVGFRNVLVHDYDEVNVDILRAILVKHLGDLEAFARGVRGRLA